MSLADDLAACPKRAAVRRKPGPHGNRYSDAQVARAKAAIALNLSRSWIAKTLGCTPEIHDAWKQGRAKAHVKKDQAAYGAMARAIEQKNLAVTACDLTLARALLGELE